jgi:hypothetical protein
MTNTIRIAIPALGLGLLAVCLVALVLGRIGPFADADERAGLATATEPQPAARASIPALDAAAPTRTATATFALG